MASEAAKKAARKWWGQRNVPDAIAKLAEAFDAFAKRAEPTKEWEREG